MHVRLLAAHAPGARVASPPRTQGRARLPYRSVSFNVFVATNSYKTLLGISQNI